MDPFAQPISMLYDAVKHVIKTTSNFKPQLSQLQKTLDRIKPIIVDIQNSNRKLGCTKEEQEMFIKEIEDAKKLVNKCSKIKWNFIKWFTYSLKLKDLDQKLLRFFQIEVQAVQCRDVKKILKEVKYVNEQVTRLALDNGSMPMSSITSERNKFGWQVPALPKGIVGFDEPLKKLKDKLLSDCDVGKVVVVSAPGGSGKTTLVKMLCNDPQIHEIFGDNVCFLTVSETPDFLVSVKDILNEKQVKFQGSEDAKNKLEYFLRKEVSGPTLLVLDDVWYDSYISNFEFDIKGYKILVTSRMSFPRYDAFKFDPLSDEHAKIIFRNSARPICSIDENLVNQMVEWCKKHPLTLSVVGSSLNGKNEVVWKSMLQSFSQGHSVLDLNQDLLNRIERSFVGLEDEFKQCFLDFGLFLEDKRISASALLDMWAHLYNHDDEGVDTLAKIYELSYRNLVDIWVGFTSGPRFHKGRVSSREYRVATPNCCAGEIVTQHDLLRELAINLNSKLPVAKRRRLIISEQNGLLVTNVQGKYQTVSFEQMQEPMLACILSISTGESFPSSWCNMNVPDVEVLVLNIKSKTYTLPPFLEEMQKMKILNITNYGFQPTELKDFHLLGCLYNLTRISLEGVIIFSSISTFELVNLQKISFKKCDFKNHFEKLTADNLNVWPRLVEMEMYGCTGYLPIFSSVYLKKLSIKDSSSLLRLPEDLGELTSLEVLILAFCLNLKELPESITKLQNLSILDISFCVRLDKLPEKMGSLGGLRTIYMCHSGGDKLPPSVKNLSNTKVICDNRTACLWKEFPNVETEGYRGSLMR